MHRIEVTEMSIDVVARKELRIEKENCHQDENYNYFSKYKFYLVCTQIALFIKYTWNIILTCYKFMI